jgi:hypothetical protein
LIRTLHKDERGQIEVLLLLLLVLAFMVAAVIAVLLAATLILTPIALSIYIWQRIFPFARSIAEWAADRINLITFFLFMQLLIIPTVTLLILWIILYWQTESVAFILLALLLIPILGLELVIFGVPMGLAIILITIRLNHHLYQRFRTRFLTFALKMVMRIAKRKQEKAEGPRKNTKRRRSIAKRKQNRVENPQKQANNPQKRVNNPQNRVDNPQSRADQPQLRPKKRKWRAKRPQ